MLCWESAVRLKMHTHVSLSVDRWQPRKPNQLTGTTRRRRIRTRDKEVEAWKRWSLLSNISVYHTERRRNVVAVLPSCHSTSWLWLFLVFCAAAEALACIHYRAPQLLRGAEEGEWCSAGKESCRQQEHHCGAAWWTQGGGQGLGHHAIPASLWYQVSPETTGQIHCCSLYNSIIN